MKRETFANHITTALSGDLLVLDSVLGMQWSKAGDSLIVRVQPVNRDTWRDVGHLVFNQLREAFVEIPFKAVVQVLRINEMPNLFFMLTPINTNQTPT